MDKKKNKDLKEFVSQLLNELTPEMNEGSLRVKIREELIGMLKEWHYQESTKHLRVEGIKTRKLPKE